MNLFQLAHAAVVLQVSCASFPRLHLKFKSQICSKFVIYTGSFKALFSRVHSTTRLCQEGLVTVETEENEMLCDSVKRRAMLLTAEICPLLQPALACFSPLLFPALESAALVIFTSQAQAFSLLAIYVTYSSLLHIHLCSVLLRSNVYQ